MRPAPLEPLIGWEVERVLRDDIEHWREHGYGAWLVYEDDIFRGRVGVRRSAVLRGLEFAWALVPGGWGRGIATIAAQAAIELARESYRGPIVAFTIPRNRSSVRVAERLGMRCEGEIRHAGLRHLLYSVEDAQPVCPRFPVTWSTRAASMS